MPGPVEIAEPVRLALHRLALSHRSEEFVARFEGVRASLRAMTGARHAALFEGSGTLANDVVAGALEGPGLILINGEFGSRLANQARGWSLAYRVLEWPWGQAWDLDQIDRALSRGADWIWGVHLETSTGMVNNIQGLASLAKRRGVRLCLDCVSSLGAIPLNLEDVWLASGVSGKALGSYAGVAMVFASEILAKRRAVPVYLDLEAALRTEGSRFTFASPLIVALEAALELQRDYAPLGGLVREKLRSLSIPPMVEGAAAAPTVTTFAPPKPGFLELCKSLGYWIGGESQYLRQRGLVQIATMGAVAAVHIEDLFHGLA
jgi:aspartate aminotransferase-like enzyme